MFQNKDLLTIETENQQKLFFFYVCLAKLNPTWVKPCSFHFFLYLKPYTQRLF